MLCLVRFLRIRKSFQKGFTLIERLVVIAIIGLLSSVVLASLSSARAKARDAQRLSGIKQMQLALELYYDKNGYYPKVLHAIGYDTTCGATLVAGCGHCQRWCDLDTQLTGFISKAPRDPLGTAQQTYYYSYSSVSGDNYQTYGLSTILENPGSLAANDGGFFSNAFEVMRLKLDQEYHIV